jgi:type IX secretion system PorP/SprF family membrane protein
MKKKIYKIVALYLFTNLCFAQDPIFTQFFMVPETLNAGFTGAKGSTNAGIIHRTQWPGLDFSINTQFAYVNNWFEEINSGLGFSILNHKETKTRYDFTQANLNYCYAVNLNDEWYFRPSISLGFGSKDFSFNNLLLEDQVNIYDGVINTTSIDPIQLNDKLNFFDFGAAFLINNNNSWFGLNLRHLNKPNISLKYQGNGGLDIFLSAHAAYQIQRSEDTRNYDEEGLYLLSNFMMQGPYNRLDVGTQYVFDKFSFAVLAATNPMKASPQSHFLTSINANVGFKWEGWKFGYSYDFNMSKIGPTGGVYEISIAFDFGNSRNCFGCPTYY